MVDVGECISEVPSRGLSFLRGLFMYIRALGLCRGCRTIGCGMEGFGLTVWFCAGRSIERSFAMSCGGGREVSVFELSSLARCVNCLMSQESMLTYVVWPRM